MPPLAAVPDLDHELDTLYALPLEDFTRARNDLVARLKRAHQDEAAAALRGVKKPTLATWTANRLARDQQELVAALLDAAEELRRTQQAALSGGATAAQVGDAATAERSALRSLIGAARQLLGSRATPSLLDRLAQTLRAAAAEDETRPLLERGRLSTELRAVGFGGLEPVAPKRRRGDDLAQAARERVGELRAEAKRLTREAVDAEQAAAEARRTADLLQEEAARAREQAELTDAALAEAERDLRTRR
jgi:hypothetical protein